MMIHEHVAYPGPCQIYVPVEAKVVSAHKGFNELEIVVVTSQPAILSGVWSNRDIYLAGPNDAVADDYELINAFLFDGHTIGLFVR